MRILIVKKTSLLFIITVLAAGLIIAVPASQAQKGASPETRDYWQGSNDIIWDVNTNEKLIALTFDDGPSPTFTPRILEILKKNHVKGTFFVIGKEAEKYPEIIRRMVYEENEIANHTYDHKYLERLGVDELRKELMAAENTIVSITGVKPKLFRPPGGYFNEDIVRVSKESGYKVIIWSWEQQSGDWANPGAGAIVSKVLKNAAPGNIVVFHDRGGDRRQTVAAMQPIIDGLKEKGYSLVTVSEMLYTSSVMKH